jgi:hypothetical protein
MPGGEPETEDQSIARWIAPGHRCDCKYSYAGVSQGLKGGHSENTGCPELRSVYKALHLVTDEEWEELARRADGMITLSFFSPERGPTRDRALLAIRQIIDGLDQPEFEHDAYHAERYRREQQKPD